jgi:hypothetical protein
VAVEISALDVGDLVVRFTVWAAVGLVFGLAAYFPLRVIGRRVRLRRFAERNGDRFVATKTILEPTWDDLAWFHGGTTARIVNGIEARVKRGFAPWRVEFGERASVVRTIDGYARPGETAAALERLNDALDEIRLESAPRRA